MEGEGGKEVVEPAEEEEEEGGEEWGQVNKLNNFLFL